MRKSVITQARELLSKFQISRPADGATDRLLHLSPQREGLSQQCRALIRQAKYSTASISGIEMDGDQATALQWFERGGQRSAIHAEHLRQDLHRYRLQSRNSRERRILPIPQIDRL